MAHTGVKRPRLLLILLFLTFVQGLFFLVFAAQYVRSAQLFLTTVESLSELSAATPGSLLTLWLSLISWLVLGIASLIVTVAMNGGRSWGWTGALLVEGTILVLMLQAYFTGRANMLFDSAMALAVGITFLLNQRDVRVFFHAHRHEHLENQGLTPIDSVEH